MHNTYFEAKKQVGEHVEKSPEPKKYRLYKVPQEKVLHELESLWTNDQKVIRGIIILTYVYTSM